MQLSERRVDPAIFMSTTLDNDVSWRLTVAGPLPLRCWDGDYVVYNPLSGDTHLLDIVTGEVLRMVMAACTRVSEVREGVAEFLEVPNDSNVAEQVDVILDALDRLGLIEPADGC